MNQITELEEKALRNLLASARLLEACRTIREFIPPEEERPNGAVKPARKRLTAEVVKSEPIEREFLSSTEAARVLGVSKKQVNLYAQQGRLHPEKRRINLIGGRPTNFFDPAELAAFKGGGDPQLYKSMTQPAAAKLALSKRPMTVAQLTDELVRGGYPFHSNNPKQSIGTMLRKLLIDGELKTSGSSRRHIYHLSPAGLSSAHALRAEKKGDKNA